MQKLLYSNLSYNYRNSDFHVSSICKDDCFPMLSFQFDNRKSNVPFAASTAIFSLRTQLNEVFLLFIPGSNINNENWKFS